MKITNFYPYIINSNRFVLIFGLLLAISVSALGQQITISRPGSSMDYEMDVYPNVWEHKYNSTYTYDNQGRLLERITVTVPKPNRPSENYTRQVFSYDQYGNQTENSYYTAYFSPTNSWELSTSSSSRKAYTYDSAGRVIERLHQSGTNNNGSNIWYPYSQKITYTYNNDGTLSEQIIYGKPSNIWTPNTKTTYNYSNGINTSTLTERYQNGVWENYHRNINYVWFTVNDKPSSYVHQTYTNGLWENSSKVAYIYLPYEGYNMVEERWQNGAWLNYYMITIINDQYLNRTDNIQYHWRTNTNTWDITFERNELLTYNANNDMTERITRLNNASYPGYYDSKEVYSNFQYFTITGQPEEATQLKAEVYPNPTSDFITIQLPETKSQILTAALTDVTGKNVWTRSLETDQPISKIDISALPAGVYLLQLQTKDNFKIVKIIKQ